MFESQRHRCICCEKDDATGRGTEVVSPETIAYGIIDLFSSESSSLGILLSRIDNTDIPDELRNGLNMRAFHSSQEIFIPSNRY